MSIISDQLNLAKDLCKGQSKHAHFAQKFDPLL